MPIDKEAIYKQLCSLFKEYCLKYGRGISASTNGINKERLLEENKNIDSCSKDELSVYFNYFVEKEYLKYKDDSDLYKFTNKGYEYFSEYEDPDIVLVSGKYLKSVMQKSK